MSRTSAAADGASSSMSDMARAIARGSPARTRSAREEAAATSGGQQLTRDHQTLHLARALTNGDELHVTEEFLGWIVFDEAVAAVDLHTVFGDADGGFTGIELGHGRLERHAPALIAQPG